MPHEHDEVDPGHPEPRCRAHGVSPEEIARYEGAANEYVRQRDELRAAMAERVESGDMILDPLTEDSLRIVTDAVQELQAALAKDPHNRDLRELLLRTYDREVRLLRRISALP